MKKSLVALAVLGAFAGAASAQSSVTLYGLADIGFYRVDPKAPNAATTNSIASGIQSGSRFGLRGSEDLGGGMRAVFQLENGFSVDDGTLGQGGRLFGRWAWAGVAGSFGEFRLGRQWAMGFEMFGEVDVFGTGFNDAGLQSTMSSANAIRLDNMVAYRSPALGPVRINAGYSFQAAGAEVAGSGANASVSTLGARGAFGPVVLVGTYEAINNPSGAPDAKHTQLGAVIDVKVLKIHAAWASEKNQITGFGPRRGNLAQVVAGSENKAMSYAIGATVPVGSGNILFQYQNRDMDIETPTIQDHRTMALGYTFPFSRRTNMYAYFADTEQKNIQSTSDRKELSVGLRHTF